MQHDESERAATGEERQRSPLGPDDLAALCARLASGTTTERMAAVFKVLADPSRCRIAVTLLEAGELCVGDLAAAVGTSESNASHHLRVLRSSGLVRGRRAGKLVFYSPDDAHIRVLLETTRDHVEHGRPLE